MKILILGASGQVGYSLACAYEGSNNDLFGSHNNPKMTTFAPLSSPSIKVDISDYREVNNIIDECCPDVVYLPAALTDVDLCEQLPLETRKVNVLGVKHVVDKLKITKSLLIYYSTDFVFDGKEGNYADDAMPNPINEYGKQKLIAEHYISTNLENYYIIRTNLIYSPVAYPITDNNYVYRALKKLRNGNVVQAIVDEWVTPTYGPDLADFSISLASSDQSSGIYHIGGYDLVNRYKFTLTIARVFDCDERLVQPVFSHELNRPAKRPLNGGLSPTTFAFMQCCGYEEGLQRFKEFEENSKC